MKGCGYAFACEGLVECVAPVVHRAYGPFAWKPRGE